MKPIVALVLATFFTGCSMANSRLLDDEPGRTCHSTAGQYHLPLSFIKIQINELEEQGSTKPAYYINDITASVKADPDNIYCLDFLASPTSEDTFMVKKEPSGVLARITSDAQDKSQDIFSNLIRTLFIGISENPTFGENYAQAKALGPSPRLGATKRFEAEWDPFNTARAAVINDAIRAFGFCLVLDGTIDQRYPSIQDYCDHPTRYTSREAMLLKANADQRILVGRNRPPLDDEEMRRWFPRPFASGIYYRPRIPYKYSLYVKKNRQVPGGWLLRGSATVMLENRSPVLSVGIDRAFFATRTTTLVFEEGTLRDIEIKKGSELAGFVNIPLQIAQSIAALPTNIIQVKIDATNNEGQLIAAQTALLEAERQRTQQLMDLETLRKGGAKSLAGARTARSLGGGFQTVVERTAPANSTTGNVDFDKCMAGCKGMDEVQCKSYCNCRLDAGRYDQTGEAGHANCKHFIGQ